MGDLTELLQQWRCGDPNALRKVTEAIYEELRRMAAHYLRNERPCHTLQATVLVHEVYLRLDSVQEIDWKTRSHFFSVVATLMRNILVDHARKRNARKRSAWMRMAPQGLSESWTEQPATDVDVLAVHEALDKMMAQHPNEARLVELRFFGGLDVIEAARIIGTSRSTVERQWRFARAWLRDEISGQH
jgi:RNA polymerase sigma-70 factor (ECF subfamily)